MKVRIAHPLGAALLLCLLALSSLSASARTLLIVGDSISAGWGVELEQGWVSLLQQRLAEREMAAAVVNASVSGETSSGGLARLPALLEAHQPDLLMIELGGNDGLRGTPLATMQQNLSQMIELGQAAGADVLLLGMRIPPNYGPRYTQGFEQVFVDLAAQYRVPLMPFFLEGVAGDPALMQDDGIHPRAEAQSQLLENAWPLLADWLGSAGD
ncbi:arylesterase [Halopseudomonas yangmingensis]|uniref:Acyl-CoA thioesterase-1 n=1 Tax=Halopseudomonas yangmingensis TaxID=1720063 RepID=A0A1I4SXW1_9GAMM|nr:arylesterase [Halopseudomonas yangmingensis]SFM69237.1 acyl-CoA thioesterase-1 [Halopseudomonas yangmingensis]